MRTIRKEIYDNSGLIRVEFIEVEEQTTEELIVEKEEQLLAVYEEIKKLKESL
jgi:hypothetical protein